MTRARYLIAVQLADGPLGAEQRAAVARLCAPGETVAGACRRVLLDAAASATGAAPPVRPLAEGPRSRRLSLPLSLAERAELHAAAAASGMTATAWARCVLGAAVDRARTPPRSCQCVVCRSGVLVDRLVDARAAPPADCPLRAIGDVPR